MLNLGDIVRVMEHPYSDASYYVGEVIQITDDNIHCLTLSRVRGGRPVPLNAHNQRFQTALPSADREHDRYRARLGRAPRIRCLVRSTLEPIWQPNVA